jgi:two-component system, response regulator, stage 0 sporulation protein F
VLKEPKHVLVVEDDAGIRTLIQDVLCDRGYTVAVAQSGTEALDEIREHPPDLVLLDLMLPGMNGWMFLQERERDRELVTIPVLVVSASGAVGVGEAQDLGAPVCLAKPFEVDDLVHEVERLCDGPIRQCAWCRRVTDRDGEFRLRSGRKLRWASHGICPTCKDRERQALLN